MGFDATHPFPSRFIYLNMNGFDSTHLCSSRFIYLNMNGFDSTHLSPSQATMRRSSAVVGKAMELVRPRCSVLLSS